VIALAPRSSSARVMYAVPIHTMAGLTPRPRLGIFGIDTILGSVIGGVFGAQSESKQLKAQQKIEQARLNQATAVAQMEKDLGMAQVDAAVQTSRIQAANELAALNAGYSASLSSMRTKKALAEDALSAQLVSSTQTGIFGLAQSGMEQAGALATSYPRTSAMTIVLLLAGTAWAISSMKNGRGKNRRRKRGKFGRAEFSASRSFTPAPSYGGGMDLSS
jgi:hypothetical protein